MENPATWTPLHHEINKVAYASSDPAPAIVQVLHKHNYHITLDQVQAIINKHSEDVRFGICGLSLPSMIVNNLTKEEYQ